MNGDLSCEHTIYPNWIRPAGVQKWEANAHVCAASAAMATGRQDIAFEELDAEAARVRFQLLDPVTRR